MTLDNVIRKCENEKKDSEYENVKREYIYIDKRYSLETAWMGRRALQRNERKGVSDPYAEKAHKK